MSEYHGDARSFANPGGCIWSIGSSGPAAMDYRRHHG